VPIKQWGNVGIDDPCVVIVQLREPHILAYTYVNVAEVIPASTLILNFGSNYCLSFK
jgi:hypothetical protein